MTPPHAPLRLSLLLQSGLVYGLLGWLSHRYFLIDDSIGIFWPASGWALASLLLWGPRMAWGIALAGAALVLTLGASSLVAAASALGTAGSALIAYQLLQCPPRVDRRLHQLRDYGQILYKGALIAPLFSALLGVSSLTLSGALPLGLFLDKVWQWWAGDALGVLVVCPLVLAFAHPPYRWPDAPRLLETLLVIGLGVAAGLLIFFHHSPGLVPQLERKAYWLFALVVWAAFRLGARGLLVFLGIVTTQCMVSILQNVGFFANPSADFRLIDGWLYVTTLNVIGMTLAAYVEERHRTEATLRIAATAFECQEGMIIIDANQRILRTNHSFTRITGYKNAEVAGRTTDFLHSDRHPATFYENAWRRAREVGTWSGEVWHRRKNGEVFPQWLTSTAVRDGHGAITHFVVTHTDISYRKRQEAHRIAEQLAQRDALVREVHHRIKNNLQGITGLLRQFAQAHPETERPINQAIGQVRSIAVIHGLQGRASDATVRLCELTREIARDLAALWQVPIRVDIPAGWIPCIVAEAEAVPLALVLNELITNAVKHSASPAAGVDIRLRKADQLDHVRLRISNAGAWTPPASDPERGPVGSGLQLVTSLLPRSGVQMAHETDDDMIHVLLHFQPPVITLETTPTCNASASHLPAESQTFAG